MGPELEIQEPSIAMQAAVNTHPTLIIDIPHNSSVFVKAMAGELSVKVRRLRKLGMSAPSIFFLPRSRYITGISGHFSSPLIPATVHPYLYVASP